MRSYVTATWGWDENVQREHHARAFNPSRWQIITSAGQISACSTSSTALTRSTWPALRSPDHQGHGIGTRLVSALFDEARQNGKALVLDVLAVNHRAQVLYQRLGMTEVARHGDNNIKITMRSARPNG
jgi:GNAT superfamily N-acetyltransferase